jgi:hypothetical protein
MWQTLIGLFAAPLGAIINKGITIAASSVIAYSVAKGNPLGDVTNIIMMLAVGLSTLISGFAASQGIQIPIINNDPTNGVKVVAMSSPSATVNAPIK